MNGTCNKCSLFAALEAGLSDLELQLRINKNDQVKVASQPPVADAVRLSVAPPSRPSAVPKQPGQLGDCSKEA